MPEDNKNKFTCWECEAKVEHIEHHHPVPRSRGGKKTIPLCHVCHSKAHHRKKNMNIGKLIAGGIKQKKASMGEDWTWGFSNPKHPGHQEARAKGIEIRQSKAYDNASKIVSAVKELEAQGIKSRQAQVVELEKQNITTTRGCKVTNQAINKAFNMVERLESKYNK